MLAPVQMLLQAGGSVKLYSHEEGGTLTELRLPRDT